MHPRRFARGFTAFRFLGVLCVAALFAAPISAFASCAQDPECDDVSAWAVFTRIALRQSVSGSDEAIEWLGFFDHKALDVSIDIAAHGTKEPMAGTVGLVGGHVMLTKGLKLQPGYEIDALDAPVLSMRLVMILLKRAFPKGPEQIVGPTNVDETGRVGIKYATPSASGYIAAPWHLKGNASRLADGTLRFDLALSFPMQQRDKQTGSITINMKGELAVLGRPVFRDTDSLEGWTTYGLGPQQTKQGSSTILDYGAKPQEDMRYRTIADIRAFIAAENHPGVRDATKDFTGFWKKKCEEPFGLQIKHHGDEGKYSIVFCGPGGCGDPSQSRLTFITGDKRYEVVSEGELMEIGRSGDREIYYRCTKDTNPVLKYRQ
jgi:hypothetical protein